MNEQIPLKQKAKEALSLEASSEAQWGRKCLLWLLAPNADYSQWLLKAMCETVHVLPCAPALGEAGVVGISYYHRQRGSSFVWEDFSPMHLLPVQHPVSQLTPLQLQLTGKHLPLSPSASHSLSHPVTLWQPSYSIVRVSAELCALALHGAPLESWGCG